MKIQQLVDEWIIDNRVRARRGFSSKTELAYRSDLALFSRVLADLEARPGPELIDEEYTSQNSQIRRIGLEDFTDAKIAKVFSELIESGHAPASRGRLLSALRGFCSWLVKQGKLPVNPTEDFETPQVSEKLPVAFTSEELSSIFASAAAPPKRLRSAWAARDVAIVAVLAGCGLRSSEMTELRIGAISRSEPFKVRVTGKGNKDRMIPIALEVLERIDIYLLQRSEKFETSLGDDDILFVRNDGRPLNNQALQNLVNNWLGEAGVAKPVGEKAHAFRHTYAVSQLDHGTNPAELQALLGHKNLATTSQYLRLSADGLHHTARATAVNEILDDLDN